MSPGLDTLQPSVDVSLPPEAEAFIAKCIAAAERDGDCEVWTTVIHEALWRMRSDQMTEEELQAEFDEAIEEGLNSGPGTPVTPQFWKDLRERAEKRHREIEDAQRRGLIGNLLLPKELHTFVTAEVARGAF